MKIYPALIMALLMLNASNSWAYGSSSSTKACTKPKFSEFTPADKAEIAPKSEFSFVASSNTAMKSLKVTVKDLPVTVTSKTQTAGDYVVTGVLPATLANTFARINISGETTSQCKGSDGWLVKITQ